mmetsp:Transcript_53333/g.126229  ORF Transcript_53333/g.126229 Transcript_53333/m.126229 type:complete len:89 (-) Transcript_53333:40-306(-)
MEDRAGITLSVLAHQVVGQFGVPMEKTLKYAVPESRHPTLKSFLAEYPDNFRVGVDGWVSLSQGADSAAVAEAKFAASRIMAGVRLAR